ncbi:juvenile hormone acid O-methyltransferase-like [Tubulanus polymorphus]|uniref:juvenile hormone acid O-methyltransferase-like n=1 Tax=Tubulanus polymorphus TaxID=672921 RepID=UPI003DA4250E
MNPNAELYSNASDGNRNWAANVLSTIDFKPGGYSNVLDIGCGSGEVTNTILSKLDNVEHLTAFDKYESMVDFARSKNPNPKIEYLVADLTDPDSYGADWRRKFDLVTSFMVLHWTPNQYKNLENIKRLLSVNGEVVLVLITSSMMVHMCDVDKLEKWSPYFQGFTPDWSLEPSWEEYSEWRSPDIVSGYRRMAESLGFAVKRCEITTRDYTFSDRESAKQWFGAILPHVKRIPESKLAEFMDDALGVYMRKVPVDENATLHMAASAVVVHLQIIS